MPPLREFTDGDKPIADHRSDDDITADVLAKSHALKPATLEEVDKLLRSDPDLAEGQIDWNRLRFQRVLRGKTHKTDLGKGGFGKVECMELMPAGSFSSEPTHAHKTSRDLSSASARALAGVTSVTSGDLPSLTAKASLQDPREPACAPTLVAVKTLLEDAQDTASANDFRREIKIMQSMDHPHCCAFVGWGFKTTDNDPSAVFLAQELCSGGSLSDAVTRCMTGGVGYNGKAALGWCLDIAKAIEYLHYDHVPPVIHRDLKLANCLLDKKPVKPRKARAGEFVGPAPVPPKVKLCDFGIAKPVLGNPAPDSPDPSRSASRTGGASARASGGASTSAAGATPAAKKTAAYAAAKSTIGSWGDMTGDTGSAAYMAPEVARSEKYTRRADVFSFGVIVYELFTKNTLSAKHDPNLEAYLQARSGPRNYRDKIPAYFPDALKDLVESCWRPDSNHRPTAKELRRNLQSLVDKGACDGILNSRKFNVPVCNDGEGCTGCVAM